MELALNLSKLSLNEIEIHLSGDLGAGKTHLARSIISNAGWQGVVKSPTYTLCEEYELDEFLFLHIDLYRTLEIEDIDIFNIDRKTHKKKIIIIEWPENLLKKDLMILRLNLITCPLEEKLKLNQILSKWEN